MASVSINANLNLNQQSVNSAAKQVQSTFNNININPRSLNTFSNALGRITGQASEFQKSMDAATARVFAFGATAAVIQSISQSFKALVSTTIEVEKRLTEISAIFGTTEKQFSKFRESIFQVAKNTGQSFNVVADGAAELARQGLSAEETAKRLNAALILTRVSGLDSVSSVNALTAAINGFTSASLDATTIVNKLVAVDTAFAVSAKDLADAFQRAGSTAEDAGVSFDELLGIVTAVQQTTSRGGAVIGNALKSIFTRISRSSTISELQALGVQINENQTGIQKLQALSEALERVSNPSTASQIKELAGGVFQINVVSAALKDLSNEASIFEQASQTAAGASNQALEKNAQLNQTLAAQINSLVAGLTNLGEKIGQLTFAPLLSDLVQIAEKITSFLSDALSEENGNFFIKSFFKGIGLFLRGPGLILITTAFLNIFKLVAKFAKEGFSQLTQLSSGSQKIKEIEQGIIQLLSQDKTLRSQLASATLTQAQKQQLVIDAIKRENQLLLQQKAILESLARTAASAGVGGFGPGVGFKGKKGKGTFTAGGFVPSFAEEMMERSMASDAGYKAGNVKKRRMFDGAGGSFVGVYNDAETVTDVSLGGKKGTFVIPPTGFAANGYIPNFVKKGAFNRLTSKWNPERISKASKTNISTQGFDNLANADPSTLTPEEKELQTALITKRKGADTPPLGSQQNRIGIDTEDYSFITPRPVDLSKYTGARGPDGLFKDGNKKVLNFTEDGISYSAYNFKNFSPNIPVAKEKADKAADPLDEDFENKIKADLLASSTSYANDIRKLIGKEGGKSVGSILDGIFEQGGEDGVYGAAQAAVGAAFEAATNAGLDISLTEEQKALNKKAGDFDLRTVNEDVRTLFGNDVRQGDYKVSGSIGNLTSFAKKVLKERAYLKSASKRGIKNTASGYIPNFADLGLNDAIDRELDGTGISKSQVRIGQDKAFAGNRNPLGLAVTNTRDEPNGISDVLAASGYVPNFIMGAGIQKTNFRSPQSLPQSSTAREGGIGKSLAIGYAISNIGILVSSIEGLDEKFQDLTVNASLVTSSFATVDQLIGGKLTGIMSNLGKTFMDLSGKAKLAFLGKAGLVAAVGIAAFELARWAQTDPNRPSNREDLKFDSTEDFRKASKDYALELIKSQVDDTMTIFSRDASLGERGMAAIDALRTGPKIWGAAAEAITTLFLDFEERIDSIPSPRAGSGGGYGDEERSFILDFSKFTLKDDIQAFIDDIFNEFDLEPAKNLKEEIDQRKKTLQRVVQENEGTRQLTSSIDPILENLRADIMESQDLDRRGLFVNFNRDFENILKNNTTSFDNLLKNFNETNLDTLLRQIASDKEKIRQDLIALGVEADQLDEFLNDWEESQYKDVENMSKILKENREGIRKANDAFLKGFKDSFDDNLARTDKNNKEFGDNIEKGATSFVFGSNAEINDFLKSLKIDNQGTRGAVLTSESLEEALRIATAASGTDRTTKILSGELDSKLTRVVDPLKQFTKGEQGFFARDLKGLLERSSVISEGLSGLKTKRNTITLEPFESDIQRKLEKALSGPITSGQDIAQRQVSLDRIAQEISNTIDFTTTEGRREGTEALTTIALLKDQLATSLEAFAGLGERSEELNELKRQTGILERIASGTDISLIKRITDVSDAVNKKGGETDIEFATRLQELMTRLSEEVGALKDNARNKNSEGGISTTEREAEIIQKSLSNFNAVVIALEQAATNLAGATASPK